MAYSLPRRYLTRFIVQDTNNFTQQTTWSIHNRLQGLLTRRNIKIFRKRDVRTTAMTGNVVGSRINPSTGKSDAVIRTTFSDRCESSLSTVFALASGHGRCGVAVVRVSGRHAGQALTALSRRRSLPPPREAVLTKLYHPVSGQQLDKALMLWFPGPASFTGEDCCEFHVHGGSAVIQAVLDALAQIPGCRAAEAGDFTKRAFSNGKLDLTEVEALSDLIHAETEAQRKQALRQMEGELAHMYATWRQRLLKCIANVEAFIDFSEEENIEDGIMDQVEQEIHSIIREIEHHLADNRKGERLRSGVHVTIMGETNVGKSSLLNALCQRPAAIVSPVAGTTRDIVETPVNLGGYPVLLSDTAGLRETDDIVEQEGVKRALKRIQEADLKILVLDTSKLDVKWPDDSRSVDSFISDHRASLGDKHNVDNKDLIVVLNKSDLHKIPVAESSLSDNIRMCALSCKTREGLDDFLTVLQERVKQLCGDPSSGNPSLTQSRHRDHLTQCRDALHAFLDAQTHDQVLAAHQLRKATRHIGKITGKITSEEILDVIFRDFCIGK